MIIITLKRGIVGVERQGTDEEIILKDYDLDEYPPEVKWDMEGYFVETEM